MIIFTPFYYVTDPMFIVFLHSIKLQPPPHSHTTKEPQVLNILCTHFDPTLSPLIPLSDILLHLLSPLHQLLLV